MTAQILSASNCLRWLVARPVDMLSTSDTKEECEVSRQIHRMRGTGNVERISLKLLTTLLDF